MSLPHLFASAPLGLWLSLIREHGGVPPRYWGRLAGILSTSTLTLPLRISERLLFDRLVARTALDRSPVFIQGFARSGTTHLHNLMAHDPAFGYVSTLQAMASPFFLVSRGWLVRLIENRMPSKRPMDNLAVSPDLPQEEELALAAVSPLSSVHLLSFPARARAITEKMGTMQLTEIETAKWEHKYLEVLRKASLASGRRRLVLKTPANLGRTSWLLRLFPAAKFIFIVRNPYVVYASTMKLYRTLIPLYQVQDVNWDEVEAAMVRNYVAMTQQYLRDRESIPNGNLVEIRFEDIETDAIGTLELIYSKLALPDWERARQPIADYLETLSGYRKNRYRFDRSLIDIVDREWGFAVRNWGYEPPGLSD